MGISLAVKFMSLLGGVLMQLILARILGVNEFGLYTFVWATMSTLLIVGKMGFEFSSIRFVADYRVQQNWDLLTGFVRRSRWLVLALTIGEAAVAALILNALHSSGRIESSMFQTFSMALVVMPFFGLLEVQAGILRGANWLSVALFTQNAMFPIGVGLLAPLIILFDLPRTATSAMLISFIVTVSTVLLQFVLIRRAMPAAARGVTPAYETRSWLKVSGAIMLSTGVEQLMRQLDVIVVGAFIGTAASGIYAVAARFAKLVNVGLQISNQSTAHMFTPLYRQGRQEELQKVVSFTTFITMLTTIPIIIVLFFFPEQILRLFGEAFSQEGALVLQILLIGQFVNAISGPNGVLMYMTQYQNEMIVILVAALVLDVFLMIVLVPSLQLAGVALAASTATIFRNLATTWRVRYHLSINTTIFTPYVWKELWTK